MAPTTQNPKEVSEANSLKLDAIKEQITEIMFLLKGSGEDTPGVVKAVARLNDATFGVKGSGGLTQRVDIMWRIYIWLLCTMSGVAGYWIKDFVDLVRPHP